MNEYRSPKNHKPKWVAWGICKRCSKKFDTRNHTRVYCPDCTKKVGKLVEGIYKFNFAPEEEKEND